MNILGSLGLCFLQLKMEHMISLLQSLRSCKESTNSQLANIRSNHGTKFENALKYYVRYGIDHKFYAYKTP